MPPALAKIVQRHNEVHGNVPQVPKQDRLQQPFQPRHKQVKATANMAEQSVPTPDPPLIMDSPNADTTPSPTINPSPNATDLSEPPAIAHSTDTIQPSAGNAEIANIVQD